MPNTFTQIHVQCVFAVKYRDALIDPSWKNELEKYITEIVQHRDHKMIAINSMPDHLHMFFGMRPTQSISDLMEMVKGDSSEWINKKGFTNHRFRWQTGYGAFSYSKSQIPLVADYVENQQIHHKSKSFLEEYKELLEEFDIRFDEKYLFHVPV